jgi:enamine deaminase RidA (YjgF/YER057c/UK114 family)
MNEIETAAGLAATPGYRYADRAGGHLFVAGQVPLGESGDLVGRDDPAAQTNACLDNLRVLVEAHDLVVADIHRLVLYVVGPQEHLSEAWRAARSWFGGEVPPATLLGVARLGYPDQLVEVDATVISTG